MGVEVDVGVTVGVLLAVEVIEIVGVTLLVEDSETL